MDNVLAMKLSRVFCRQRPLHAGGELLLSENSVCAAPGGAFAVARRREKQPHPRHSRVLGIDTRSAFPDYEGYAATPMFIIDTLKKQCYNIVGFK